MHVHILNKVCDQKKGDCDKHTVTHTGTQVSIGALANMGRHVSIKTYTDACTHSKQGVWPEVGWLGHTHTASQGHPGSRVTNP